MPSPVVPPVPGSGALGMPVGIPASPPPSFTSRSKSLTSVPLSAALVYWAQICAGYPPPLMRACPSALYSGVCSAVSGSWPMMATTVASSGV